VLQEPLEVVNPLLDFNIKSWLQVHGKVEPARQISKQGRQFQGNSRGSRTPLITAFRLLFEPGGQAQAQ
jgi:hypothetical protein